MRFGKGKVHIKKEDLNRRVILVKNYKDEDELNSVRAGVMDAAPGVLVIPVSSLKKLNDFRLKNRRLPLLQSDLAFVDVEVLKKERDELEKKKDEDTL